MNRVIDHVVGNLHKPIRLDQLARLAHLSPFHFHRVFQAMIGETPANFVRRLRLEKSLRMMAHNKRQSLTDIAHACGFRSSSDFSRSFKQQFGAAPKRFDLAGWQQQRLGELEQAATQFQLAPASADSSTEFTVNIRSMPKRTFAYIVVHRPYQPGRVKKAAEKLIRWAERSGFADGPWVGYQFENPTTSKLADCRYYIAVAADHFSPKGDIGKVVFPAFTVAEITIKGDVELELNALQWLYGTWLPNSRYVPDDQPAFEAFIGKPFAHGDDYFELNIHLPIKRLP